MIIYLPSLATTATFFSTTGRATNDTYGLFFAPKTKTYECHWLRPIAI